ncbi:hypothetical protein PUN28_000769 [Cardiocondyla obscurior]|uniref:Uncharacterized protein n=1 Tax=Cardiocondyla obscurior TaxID=286306 RepID=A0AAW2H107_9HYME
MASNELLLKETSLTSPLRVPKVKRRRRRSRRGIKSERLDGATHCHRQNSTTPLRFTQTEQNRTEQTDNAGIFLGEEP